MRRSLAGEGAIVTGARSGIGAATAPELGRRGATVVLAARRAAALQEHARAIRAVGADAMVVPTDVADAAQLAQLIEQATAAFGRVDVLVNNAGTAWSTSLASTPADDVERLVEVNLLAAM